VATVPSSVPARNFCIEVPPVLEIYSLPRLLIVVSMLEAWSDAQRVPQPPASILFPPHSQQMTAELDTLVRRIVISQMKVGEFVRQISGIRNLDANNIVLYRPIVVSCRGVLLQLFFWLH
jgi:hypothetical protein